ncbi:T9SS type A sorting domain-containing protein [bacterium]|nr:T9SS type A sorting domain-containing protein [bacterium]
MFALLMLVTSFSVHAQDAGAATDVQLNKMVGIKYTPNGGVIDPAAGSSFGKIGRNVGVNTLVNAPQLPIPNGRLGRSETIIASDPSGTFLVAGWNDAEGFCGPPWNAPCAAPSVPGLSGYAWSGDGGQSWTDGGTPTPHMQNGATWITRGDPWFTTGGPGMKTYYYSNMSVPLVDNSAYGQTGLLIHRGSFKGKNFSFNNSVLIPPTKANGADTYDKEAITAGKNGGTKDMVAVSVTNFIEIFGLPQWGFGQIEVYTSSDRAGSFATHAIVQADEAVTANTGVVNQGSAVAIAPNGDICVAWERGWFYPLAGTPDAPQIVFAKSTDGGASFSPRTTVSDISSGAFFPPTGYNRSNTNDFPRMAIATGDDDPFQGRIYVAYQDSRIANGGPQSVTGGFGNGDTDVYLSWSSDGGATWSAGTLVAGGTHAQFWPAVDVQPDGTVDMVWYDNDGAGIVDVYYAGSEDGGVTFSTPMLVTSSSTDWTNTVANMTPNFGDYIGIASSANRTLACWGDGSAFGYPSVYSAVVAYGTPKNSARNGAVVRSLDLAQNYPNPFNPSTVISYNIASPGYVMLRVYNAVGQQVATLVDGLQSSGNHKIDFDASQLAGGMYMYRLTVGNESVSRSMMLIK